MDEAHATARPRRTLIICASIVTAAVVAIVVIVLLALPEGNDQDAPPGAASRSLARLAASDGRAYVGSIGDAGDPVTLRRALRAEFRSDDTRVDRRGSPARAQRCATELQRASDERRGRVVLLADATLAGEPAVVVGIADRGRVVAFVADAETCGIRMAQSL
ncbi:MAG: hypothetical protein ACXW2Y_04915 [Acidimicrobiia bacterium]